MRRALAMAIVCAVVFPLRFVFKCLFWSIVWTLDKAFVPLIWLLGHLDPTETPTDWRE